MSRIATLLCALALLSGSACGGVLPLLGGEPLAWEQPPPRAQDAPVVRGDALLRRDLSNGVRVMALEDHRVPVVTLALTVRRGAAIVETERAGLASFTAELMRRGAGGRDALELAQAVDEVGAELSVNAGWDSMSVSVSGLSRDLDRLVEVLADVVLRPRFDPAEGARARAEQLAALEKGRDDPSTLVRTRALAVLYPGHRYGLLLPGEAGSVAGLKAAAARDFHARVFVPNDAILSASGDIDPENWIERAEAVFGPATWPRSDVAPASEPPPQEVPAARRVVVVDRPDLEQAQIVVGHEGIGRRDEGRIAADMMNKVLGGSGFASRLMQRVRSDEGLTYGVSSGFLLRRHPGPFWISTFTRAAETRRVVDLLLEEMQRIRDEPPSEDELSRAASLATGSFGLGLETSGAVMTSLVNLDVYDLPEDSLDTYRARVRDVGTTDTVEAALRLLHPERAAIVVVGPADTVAPLLEGLGEVEVVEP